jgi:hypothetical protein
MKRNNIADGIIEAMREAAAIANGEEEPAWGTECAPLRMTR